MNSFFKKIETKISNRRLRESLKEIFRGNKNKLKI